MENYKTELKVERQREKNDLKWLKKKFDFVLIVTKIFAKEIWNYLKPM